MCMLMFQNTVLLWVRQKKKKKNYRKEFLMSEQNPVSLRISLLCESTKQIHEESFRFSTFYTYTYIVCLFDIFPIPWIFYLE